MIKLKKLIVMLLICIIPFSLVACVNYENAEENAQQKTIEETTKSQEDNSQMIAARINDVLSDVPACEGWAPSVAGMINMVFHNYDWTFEQYEENENSYVVTFDGTYCPNPVIPELAEEGTISYLVNLETGEAELYGDPDGISSIFILYVLN